MPQHRSQSRVHSQHGNHICMVLSVDQMHDHHRDDTLKAIPQEGDKPSLPPQRPQGVGGSYIAAAFLPDVHMMQLSVEITGLDQSKGIPDDHTNHTFHL